jgi:ribonuclease BN (tRNA processing enzyme)
VRLTVLGSCASWAGSGHACSSYLVEAAGVRVVFDLGNGALANLSGVTDPLSLDAVFITHAHPDHWLDLFALQAALRFAPEGPKPPIRVYCPDGLLERAGCLLSERGRADFAAAFLPQTLADGAAVRLGPLTVTPRSVDHDGATFALVACEAGRTLCYTSDTRPGAAATVAASGAHVVLADATLARAFSGRAPHMTGEDAGRLAEGAGADTLVLTHLWPTAPHQEILQDASAVFSGRTLLAEEFLAIDI